MSAATRLLIAFYSRGGVTRALADAIAEGAAAAGADVRARRAREIVPDTVIAAVPGWAEGAAAMNALYPAPTADDAVWADAIVLGGPTRFGAVSSELKAWLDSLGGLWNQGALNGKVGSVFGSSSTPHGGNETTLTSLYVPLAHLGLIIVPLGYADPVMFAGGTPYGASSVSGPAGDAPPTDADLAVARYQGRRVAEIAAALASRPPNQGPAA